jgi:hypothetical protein
MYLAGMILAPFPLFYPEPAEKTRGILTRKNTSKTRGYNPPVSGTDARFRIFLAPRRFTTAGHSPIIPQIYLDGKLTGISLNVNGH